VTRVPYAPSKELGPQTAKWKKFEAKERVAIMRSFFKIGGRGRLNTGRCEPKKDQW